VKRLQDRGTVVCDIARRGLLFVAALLLTHADTRGEDRVTITGTLQAAVAQPQIYVQLSENQRVLEGKSALAELDLGLEDIVGHGGIEKSFIAFLDTGASAYVISRSTASRFGIATQPDAVFHEVGLHGETPMDVSRPYTLALAEVSGKVIEQPGDRFNIVDRAAIMQLSRPREGVDDAMAMLVGEINVVGMPAIQHFVVEIDPSPLRGGEGEADPGVGEIDLLANLDNLGSGPAVRLRPQGSMPADVDLRIALDMVDYNRKRNPHDRGPKPSLAANPVIRNITTTHGGRNFRGDWLLDTGAAVSIISKAQARALGLVDAAGDPVRNPDFTLPIGGISGEVTNTAGFVIESLAITDRRGRTLVYQSLHVIVHDVGIVLDDGSEVILDGVFGLNLLLPTMGGMAGGLPSTFDNGPFRRIWIDTANRTLGLKLN